MWGQHASNPYLASVFGSHRCPPSPLCSLLSWHLLFLPLIQRSLWVRACWGQHAKLMQCWSPAPRCKGNRVYALLWQPKTPCSVVNLRPLYPSDLSMHKHKHVVPAWFYVYCKYMLALFEYVCGGILNTGSLKCESASVVWVSQHLWRIWSNRTVPLQMSCRVVSTFARGETHSCSHRNWLSAHNLPHSNVNSHTVLIFYLKLISSRCITSSCFENWKFWPTFWNMILSTLINTKTWFN